MAAKKPSRREVSDECRLLRRADIPIWAGTARDDPIPAVAQVVADWLDKTMAKTDAPSVRGQR
jgi:hypothetical protein